MKIRMNNCNCIAIAFFQIENKAGSGYFDFMIACFKGYFFKKGLCLLEYSNEDTNLN